MSHPDAPADDTTTGTGDVLHVGLVYAPELALELATDAARRLPHSLPQTDEASWRLALADQPLVISVADRDQVADALEAQRQAGGWDAAIYLTDLPLRIDARPLVAAVSADRRLAVVSVPAFGATHLRPRVREALVTLLSEMAGPQSGKPPRTSTLARRRLGDLVIPIRRLSEHNGDGPVQYVLPVGTGHLRLLAGMVRANRPWRAAVGLSYAVIAAIATGAYALLNTFVQKLTITDSPLRLTAVMITVVAAVVAWLIVTHHLWEPAGEHAGRKDAALYNAATTITLVVAVLCSYALLFAGALLAAALLVSPRAIQAQVSGRVTVTNYLLLAWLGASIATVAGALGSELQSIEEIGQAAYGHHHRSRYERANQEENSEAPPL